MLFLWIATWHFLAFALLGHAVEVLCDSEIARHVAEKVREAGSDQWYKLSVQELLPERYKDQAPFLQKGN